MALSRQVVYFVRPHFKKNGDQAINIEHVAVMHVKLQRGGSVPAARLNFLIQTVHKKVLDAALIESGCVALDAVNFVALRKKSVRLESERSTCIINRSELKGWEAADLAEE